MKNNNIKKIVSIVNKELGERTAFILDENKTTDVDVIPIGIDFIDKQFGIGGIPRGRITEVLGKPGSGKTTLCIHAIANAQKMGLKTAFIDMEHAISPLRMKQLGVNINQLIFSQPFSGEEAMNLTDMLVRTGVSLIIIDSVAALIPMIEVEKDIGENVMGRHAMLMSQSMRKLTAPTHKHNVALVFINQTRASFGGFFSQQKGTGGSALRYYSSLRLQMKYTGKSVTKSKGYFGKFKMTVIKNKLAVPYKEVDFIINEEGIKKLVTKPKK